MTEILTGLIMLVELIGKAIGAASPAAPALRLGGAALGLVQDLIKEGHTEAEIARRITRIKAPDLTGMEQEWERELAKKGTP